MHVEMEPLTRRCSRFHILSCISSMGRNNFVIAIHGIAREALSQRLGHEKGKVFFPLKKIRSFSFSTLNTRNVIRSSSAVKKKKINKHFHYSTLSELRTRKTAAYQSACLVYFFNLIVKRRCRRIKRM